jgi:hypothetical protein
MKSRLVELQDPSDGFLPDTVGIGMQPPVFSLNYDLAHALGGDSLRYVSASVGSVISSVVTSASTTTDIVTFASSGIVFNNTYTVNVTQAYKNDILAAEQDIASHWTNSITLNMKFDAVAQGTGGTFLATNSFGLIEGISYTTLKNALAAHATSADAQAALATLPATDPSGGIGWSLPVAYARMLGITLAAPATDDTVILNTSYNWSYGQDVIGTIEHELTEGAMGRIGGLGKNTDNGGNPIWSTMDLFRYSASGVHDFSDGQDGKTAYFSVDGIQMLVPFNNQYSGATRVNDGDTADFSVLDVFGFGSPGTGLVLSSTDIKNMNVLGWTPASAADTQPPALNNDNPLLILAGSTQAITSSLLSASDNVSSATQLRYTVTTAPTHGTLLLNGSATSSFTQDDINNGLVSYHETASGVSSDNFSFTVSDAAGNVTAASFQININHAPVVSLSSANVAASAGQTLSASSLFSATDADGDTLTYYLDDATAAANSGHFLVNGTIVPANTGYAVTAAQLAQTVFVAGASGSSDDLFVEAFDGNAYSGWIEFHVNVAAPLNHAPVVTVPSANVAASAGQTLSASSLFSATDADGDTLTYYVDDATAAANSGHFSVNGTIVAANTGYAVTAAQLAQTVFVAGASGTSDDLFVEAYDGKAYSGWIEFHVNATAPQNHAPVVSVPSANVAASAGQTLSASSLFSATDADGDTLTYYIDDATAAANSGYFSVNGTIVPANTAYAVTAAQLAQTVFVAGASGTSDDLFVNAFDGQAFSGWNEFHVNVAAGGASHAPSSSADAMAHTAFGAGATGAVDTPFTEDVAAKVHFDFSGFHILV